MLTTIIEKRKEEKTEPKLKNWHFESKCIILSELKVNWKI